MRRNRVWMVSVLAVLAVLVGCQPDEGTPIGASTEKLTAVSAKAGGDVYVVQVAGDPAIAFEGDGTFKPTKPGPGKRFDPISGDAVAYTTHLKSKHDSVLAAVGAGNKKLYSYVYSVNGFSAVLTPQQAQALALQSGVLLVQQDQKRSLNTDTSPTFLGLNASSGIWQQLGGQKSAGEGVIVGVIDTGIWPEHPSFSDQSDLAFRPGAAGEPLRVYGPPPAHWRGTCQSGELWSQDDCNNKLIGARYYLKGMASHKDPEAGDFKSARDNDGHGTHTASTAAGNANVPATVLGQPRGVVSGIAPRARVAMYKALWAGSGWVSDLAAAIDDAVADGVDVINYSIGGGAGSLGIDELAFLWADAANVFASVSAGNEGPGPATVGSPAVAPWVTAVGASTHNRSFIGSVTLGDGQVFTGVSITGGTPSLPIVDAAAAGSELCLIGQLNPAAVAGKVVLCKRGTNGRMEKSRAVFVAGGKGMVLYNFSDSDTLMSDSHWVPTVHINYTKGLAVKSYVGKGKPTAQIAGGTPTATKAPVMAYFSSRGPNLLAADIIKPDVTAPGVSILAGTSPDTSGGQDGELFQAIAGTSMSAPHVAGLAALLKHAHPGWSPAMIKSAMVTTGYQTLMQDGVTTAGPFDVGGGHVAINAATDPGLVYNANLYAYVAFTCGSNMNAFTPGSCAFVKSKGYPFDPSDLNVPSIGIAALAGTQTVTRTVTNVGTKTATYKASISVAGFSATVTPQTLTLAPGQSAAFKVTLTTGKKATTNAWHFGALTWTDGVHSVRSPIAVRPVPLSAPEQVAGSGVAGSLAYAITFGAAGQFAAQPWGLVPAAQQLGYVVDDPADDINTALATGVGVTFHSVNIPAGTAYARFSLFSTDTDGQDDLDLYVFNPAGAYVGGSGSASSDEEVNLSNPTPGYYTVAVHGWATDGADANYTLSSWAVTSTPAGNMTVSAPTSASLGASANVNVSWTGLAAGARYLGAVAYSMGSVPLGRTIVGVSTK